MRKSSFIFFGALAIATCLIWAVVFVVQARQRNVSYYFLDVGQGDAIFIEASNGNQMLIDGGPDGTVLRRLGDVMPFWDRSIDVVLLTHPHADHLRGLLEVLERYDVEMVIESGINHSIPEYQMWREMIDEKNIQIITAEYGQRIHMDRDFVISVLLPYQSFRNVTRKDIHDGMVVVRGDHKATAVLLMGDAEIPSERELISRQAPVKANLLKIGHHGSKTSTGEWFLESVQPDYAVVSSGKENTYGHPTQEVLDRLEKLGAQVFRTDVDGTLHFISDGNSLSPSKLSPRK